MGYLYCQNTDCGIYLGASGADSCAICGWEAQKHESCPDCGKPNLGIHTCSPQPTALRLSAALEATPDCKCYARSSSDCCCDTAWPEHSVKSAAAELRRLHAENVTLIKKVTGLVGLIGRCFPLLADPDDWASIETAMAEILKDEK